MSIKTILIDDETKSSIYLKAVIENHCPQIDIVAIANTIEDAYEKVNRFNPNLIFLDIEMPPHTGFDLLKKFDSIPFEVIFVTAFHQYAINAIKFSALDYLLKPVNSEELILAIQKAEQKMEDNEIRVRFLKQIIEEPSIQKIVIRSHQGISIIELADIIYIRADGAYTHFILAKNKKVTTSKNIQEYDEMLSSKGFFRTHKSYMVNMKHVKLLSKGNSSEIKLSDNNNIPLATRRKDAFLKALSQ